LNQIAIYQNSIISVAIRPVKSANLVKHGLLMTIPMLAFGQRGLQKASRRAASIIRNQAQMRILMQMMLPYGSMNMRLTQIFLSQRQLRKLLTIALVIMELLVRPRRVIMLKKKAIQMFLKMAHLRCLNNISSSNG
uniref:Nop domain-containing protein n=1 Tax=Dracunculus medinensis TaxID=318479 RepID=A0A0N4UFU5_DRAME